jgi:hypothetical protein
VQLHHKIQKKQKKEKKTDPGLHPIKKKNQAVYLPAKSHVHLSLNKEGSSISLHAGRFP